jgi:hypothetical protein
MTCLVINKALSYSIHIIHPLLNVRLANHKQTTDLALVIDGEIILANGSKVRFVLPNHFYVPMNID